LDAAITKIFTTLGTDEFTSSLQLSAWQAAAIVQPQFNELESCQYLQQYCLAIMFYLGHFEKNGDVKDGLDVDLRGS